MSVRSFNCLKRAGIDSGFSRGPEGGRHHAGLSGFRSRSRGGCRSCSLRSRRGLGGRNRSHGGCGWDILGLRRALFHLRHDITGLHRIPFLHEDLGYHTVARRAHFEDHLIRLKLNENLILFHRVTRLHLPAKHLGARHRFG